MTHIVREWMWYVCHVQICMSADMLTANILLYWLGCWNRTGPWFTNLLLIVKPMCISAKLDFVLLASILSFWSCCACTLPCMLLRKDCDLSHEDFKDVQKTNHYLRVSGKIWGQRGRLSVATYKRYTHFYREMWWRIIWPSLFKAYWTCLLFLLLLLWRHFVLLNMLCLDSGIWNSSAPTSPTAQINATSWASAVCLLILTAQGLVVLPLLFTPFFSCPSHPHSVLSFRVLSSHPSSQSSFISRISLPEPPQPEMSQSLASFPPTLPLWPSMGKHECMWETDRESILVVVHKYGISVCTAYVSCYIICNANMKQILKKNLSMCWNN